MRAVVPLLALLVLLALVPQPASAATTAGAACRVSALPGFGGCAVATVTDRDATCADAGYARLCSVTYVITLRVQADRCAGVTLGWFFGMEACARGADHTFTESYTLTQPVEPSRPVLPALRAEVCALGPDAAPSGGDCVAWLHPPVPLPPPGL